MDDRRESERRSLVRSYLKARALTCAYITSTSLTHSTNLSARLFVFWTVLGNCTTLAQHL